MLAYVNSNEFLCLVNTNNRIQNVHFYLSKINILLSIITIKMSKFSAIQSYGALNHSYEHQRKCKGAVFFYETHTLKVKPF